MTDAIALGEKLLSLLEESARTTTYKPALLLAARIDRVPEYGEGERIPVRALAERLIELYWPQTLTYPTTGEVLRQSQASAGRAAIVQAILAFRAQHAPAARALPPAVRREPGWEELLARVEETLAEWPIPRLQRPYEPFLYNFDWGWTEAGGWSVRAYEAGRAQSDFTPESVTHSPCSGRSFDHSSHGGGPTRPPSSIQRSKLLAAYLSSRTSSSVVIASRSNGSPRVSSIFSTARASTATPMLAEPAR